MSPGQRQQPRGPR